MKVTKLNRKTSGNTKIFAKLVKNKKELMFIHFDITT